MSDSPKIGAGYGANKAEVVYEISEAQSLDNVYLAAKAKEKTKSHRVNQSELQEIVIPELGLTVYAKKDKDPKVIRKKYIDHAKEMHQRMNPVVIIPVKPQPKKKDDAKDGDAAKA